MSRTPLYLSERSVARIAEKRAERMNTPKAVVPKAVVPKVSAPVVPSVATPIPQRKDMGVIYIIGAAKGESPYKIGFTKNSNVNKRLGSIQSSTWIELKVFYQSEVIPDVTRIERRIHGRYADKRIRDRSEWFLLTKEDIQKIQHEIETNDYCDEKFFLELRAEHMLRAIKVKEEYDTYRKMGIL